MGPFRLPASPVRPPSKIISNQLLFCPRNVNGLSNDNIKSLGSCIFNGKLVDCLYFGISLIAVVRSLPTPQVWNKKPHLQLNQYQKIIRRILRITCTSFRTMSFFGTGCLIRWKILLKKRLDGYIGNRIPNNISHPIYPTSYFREKLAAGFLPQSLQKMWECEEQP